MISNTSPLVYSCALHGEYSSVTADGRGSQSYCPECERVERVAERAWRAEHARVKRFDRSGIPARFANATLESWEETTAAQRAAKHAVVEWTSKLTTLDDGVGLYFSGPPGVGKTHLAIACLIECVRRTQFSVLYAQWGSTLAEAKAAFRARDAGDPLQPLYEKQIVVLDEIGVRVGSDFDSGALFDLIDHRYREGMTTIAVTNLTSAEANAMLGERVADRLREMTLPVVLTGKSRRVGPRPVAAPELPFPRPPEFIVVPQCYAGRMGRTRIDDSSRRSIGAA
jgi:DNA replication protein DnaC